MESSSFSDSASRTALIHDWLTDWGGGENLLSALASCLEKPDLYSLIDFLPREHRARLPVGKSHTSFIQLLPGAATKFWNYLFLMPSAIESFDLSRYERVISSSHAFAKGILTNSDQLHISYLHTPMRYAWDLHHQYLADYGLDNGLRGWFARAMFHRLRQWDRQTANNVDLFVANSTNVARRIWRTYRRRSVVIYPPVETSRFVPAPERENYYVSVSRLVSYKRIDLVVQAFRQMPQRRLLVIGDGPEYGKLKAQAGPNIEFLGYQPDTVVADHLARALALVFAANEDFGITPVEAQSAGTPVIAFRGGGALETVIDARSAREGTGIFFDQQTPSSLAATIQESESILANISPLACRVQAQRFSSEIFHRRFTRLLEQATGAWDSTRDAPAGFEAAVLDNV